jgi:putative ABC transport system permease protein
MKGALYLAWKYLVHHKFKSLVLLLSITLVMYLPAGLKVLVAQTAEQLTVRADNTPLIVGSKGSPLELVLNSLYCETKMDNYSRYGQVKAVQDTGLARAIPLYARYQANKQPIVGTSLDYFAFRDLTLSSGRLMAFLGEAVIGANVAKKLAIGVGDTLVSSPETVFDMAGVYPLKMKVVGVLQPALNADDEAIFVDLKTTWVIEGLGHGHQELVDENDKSRVLKKEGNKIIANAAVKQFNEITEANIDSFHFHGANADFPITAVLAIPHDNKSKVLLLGRFMEGDSDQQIQQPGQVIDELLATIFTVQHYVFLIMLMFAGAITAVVILVFMLSMQIRQGEINTMIKIGAPRTSIAIVLIAEILMILVASAALAASLMWLTQYFGSQLFQSMLF